MTISRINKLRERFVALGIDAYLVKGFENRSYMSGFSGSNATLLITADSCELYTDFRYDERAHEEAPNFNINILSQFETISGEILKVCRADGAQRVGYESDINTVAWLDKAGKEMEGVRLVACPGAIEDLRSIKDAEEIEKIAAAQEVTDHAFTRILDFIKPGVSEIEIAAELQYYIAQKGCKLAFDTIIASGPNGSMPHAVPGERTIQKGDFVTMDYGAMYDGYCSDMTRTVAVGQPTDKMKDVYNIVLEAQLKAMELIKPGISCKSVDDAARGHIAAKGYGDRFGHGLGHSLGLYIHEEPRFSPSCSADTKVGHCMSVEPGIYLPGEFGVRIEDIIYITSDGYSNFTASAKELIIL